MSVAASPCAGIADTDHQDLGANGVEAMQALQMVLELVHQVVLDVQDPVADLADRVLVLARGGFVVHRPLAQPHRVQGAGAGERIQGPVDGAARETRGPLVQLVGALLRRAVPAQPQDRLPNGLALAGMTHTLGQRGGRAHPATTRSWRPALVSRRAPPASTTTSSSILIPPQPGM